MYVCMYVCISASLGQHKKHCFVSPSSFLNTGRPKKDSFNIRPSFFKLRRNTWPANSDAHFLKLGFLKHTPSAAFWKATWRRPVSSVDCRAAPFIRTPNDRPWPVNNTREPARAHTQWRERVESARSKKEGKTDQLFVNDNAYVVVPLAFCQKAGYRQ